MSNTASSSMETTFRALTETQGANYAKNRRDYHPDVYQAIIDYHTSTGGQLGTVLDVGSGPGTAVRSLAPIFTHAIGIDPSPGMITTARALGGATATSDPIRFEVAGAEDLGSLLSPPVPENGVDLITAAVAAHWFDMPAFWARAGQVLKPGSTVAIWTSGSMRISPSTPNAAAVQAAIDKLEASLDDYMAPGNRINHSLYVDLPLPWTLAPPLAEFDEDSFVRLEWGTANPDSRPGDRFYRNQQPADLDLLEKVLGTTSPVTRWRQAHPDAAGTERDPVRNTRREIEAVLRQAGVGQGKELIDGGVAAVLLMLKRKV
jgi:SAM-dependent methyltransferase